MCCSVVMVQIVATPNSQHKVMEFPRCEHIAPSRESPQYDSPYKSSQSEGSTAFRGDKPEASRPWSQSVRQVQRPYSDQSWANSTRAFTHLSGPRTQFMERTSSSHASLKATKSRVSWCCNRRIFGAIVVIWNCVATASAR
jgi:hypothetical protein